MDKTLYLLLSITLYSCNNEINNNISFEGKIEYAVSIEYMNDKFKSENDWYIDQAYGGIAELYINSNGDLLKQYPESGKSGFEFNSYIVNDNNGYSVWRGLDTIYGHDASINSLKFITDSIGENEQILGYDCQSIEYYGFEPISQDTVVIKQFYNNKIYLNPKPYEHCKDFFADEIYVKINSVPLMTIINYGPYVVKFRAVKIEQKKIDESIFKLNKNHPIKLS